MRLTATNPVDRHAERLASFDRELEALRNGGLDDMWDEVRTDDQIDMARYVAELEWIIYTSVRLSDIMLNGHSEATYRRINEVYEPKETTNG